MLVDVCTIELHSASSMYRHCLHALSLPLENVLPCPCDFYYMVAHYAGFIQKGINVFFGLFLFNRYIKAICQNNNDNTKLLSDTTSQCVLENKTRSEDRGKKTELYCIKKNKQTEQTNQVL